MRKTHSQPMNTYPLDEVLERTMLANFVRGAWVPSGYARHVALWLPVDRTHPQRMLITT